MTTRAELKTMMEGRRVAILSILANGAASLETLANAIKAPPSTLYFMLSRLRDNDRLIHNEVVKGKGCGKAATWHLGPPATSQEDEADAVPIRRPVLRTWPRDFPPPDPVLAALYGRRV